MRKRQKFASVAVAAVLAASLTACGGDDESSDDAESSESSTTEDASEEPADEETSEDEESEDSGSGSAGGSSASELTEPGAQLKLGETATVPMSYAGEDGVIEVTVTEIREGDPADLADVEDSDGMTPWHISYEISGVENAEAIGGMQLSLDGLTAAGDSAAQLISFSGGIGGCETESAASDWDGSAFETCNTVVSAEPVTQAAFGEGDDYSLILGSPVIWE
ncbi:hypothetical protein INN71_15915 [Nocardioides sp. ChNu-153]|uniref:hypothetical protein n=1 Tax=Nocardioides sp. ChNu-153 TaxID=2779364 RepID=UPI0026518E11|nr:hypothetical protein [Nocardioides sp. ChNu-153]MDN7122873.1 hypothetical protein [Nocardioides sp. ChNu-153]